MSLQPLSWFRIRSISKTTGMPFVHISAHHNHSLIGIDRTGNTYVIERKGRAIMQVTRVENHNSTTSGLVRAIHLTRNNDWVREILQRIEEIDSFPTT